MFKKLFGGSEPKKAPPPPPPPKPNTEEMEIEFERQINSINVKVEEMDLKIEKTQKKLENLDLDVRRLIAAKSKQQAKTKLTEAKQLRDLIEDMETKKTVFLDMKMKLELSQQNQSSISLVRDANKLMKGNSHFLILYGSNISHQFLYEKNKINSEYTRELKKKFICLFKSTNTVIINSYYFYNSFKK